MCWGWPDPLLLWPDRVRACWRCTPSPAGPAGGLFCLPTAGCYPVVLCSWLCSCSFCLSGLTEKGQEWNSKHFLMHISSWGRGSGRVLAARGAAAGRCALRAAGGAVGLAGRPGRHAVEIPPSAGEQRHAGSASHCLNIMCNSSLS